MVRITDTAPGRTALIDGRSCLFFSGFSYLGLHASHAFRDLLAVGNGRFGSVYPSSRISNLQLRLYEELEHALAAMFHQQSAVCFSSGYLAAQAAVTYAAGRGTLLHAPGAHPAIRYPGAQVPEGSVPDWLATIVETVNNGDDHQYVLVADAVNPLTATVHDFSPLAGIRKKVLVLIDDSHGIGILDDEGTGIVRSLPASPALHYLVTASLAKAFSLEGGFVAGHAADIAAIRKLPLFTASTPMIPANAYTFLHAREAFTAARNVLKQRIQALENLTAGIPALHHPHALPVFAIHEHHGGAAEAARPVVQLNGLRGIYEHLLSLDVFISSFSYPDPQGPRINRIVLSALHTQSDLEILAEHLTRFYSSIQ
ncbi:aminotransferase class I/II-fold pyridoxal phosphate-dependent enzyme [Chitinophaga cymbidii]|uniref:Aminotransferase class I/classII large domain-containing protein n=1 Tax=Chitinophaga cymbidii TaxID=1096750 RepID=A0A512RQB6_9BACT|nr:aminotransferase class I/II-fold pyridoxal phosphate-dependent enzyme [Chitinophaga cymbidii]GEP97893.1 hypothetical protein CCY01nite_41530 [Chitinophaga cymbidii]